MKTYRILSIVLCLVVFPVAGMAELYKWTDAQGSLHFTDTPPPAPRKKAVPAAEPTPKARMSAPLKKMSVENQSTSVPPQAQISSLPGHIAPVPLQKDSRHESSTAGLTPKQATLTAPWQVSVGKSVGTTGIVQRWKDEAGIDHFTDVLSSPKGGAAALAKIEEVTAKQQKIINQAGQWGKLSAEQRRDVTAKKEQLDAQEKAAWEAATPQQRRAYMMKALAPIMEGWKKECMAGKADMCLTMAAAKKQDGNLVEAANFYELGCRHGNRKACSQHIIMEAVEGSPRRARSLMSALCPIAAAPAQGEGKAKDDCSKLRLVVDALPPPAKASTIPYVPEVLTKWAGNDVNIQHTPFPKAVLEHLPNLSQAATPSPQAGAAGHAYSEALQLLLGIDRPVDLPKATRLLNEAQAQGFDVADRLITLGQALIDAGSWPNQSDSILVHYKNQLLLRKSCEAGNSQACFFASAMEEDRT